VVSRAVVPPPSPGCVALEEPLPPHADAVVPITSAATAAMVVFRI
jgi:hypothetical protein